MRYKVTEVQRIRYTWFVEAESQEEAEATAVDGVPDDATSKLASETHAELDPTDPESARLLVAKAVQKAEAADGFAQQDRPLEAMSRTLLKAMEQASEEDGKILAELFLDVGRHRAKIAEARQARWLDDNILSEDEARALVAEVVNTDDESLSVRANRSIEVAARLKNALRAGLDAELHAELHAELTRVLLGAR